MGMGEDEHESFWNSHGAFWFIDYIQSLALLRYPVSGVLRLIMNCGRVADFGWEGGGLYAH